MKFGLFYLPTYLPNLRDACSSTSWTPPPSR